ncbi:hypothetical protein C0J52_15478, partial [Blattella germanica]
LITSKILTTIFFNQLFNFRTLSFPTFSVLPISLTLNIFQKECTLYTLPLLLSYVYNNIHRSTTLFI